MKLFSKAMIFAMSLLMTGSYAAFADSGTATANLNLVVPVVTTVSCSSSTVTAPTGTQTNTLAVVCTLAGNASNLSGSNANSFQYPGNLSNGTNTLPVSPVAQVTSPNNSVTGINGNYNGFNGNLSTGATWRIQSTATVPTTSATPAGTYTGTVTYNYSTL